jgi:hypothetical protein
MCARDSTWVAHCKQAAMLQCVGPCLRTEAMNMRQCGRCAAGGHAWQSGNVQVPYRSGRYCRSITPRLTGPHCSRCMRPRITADFMLRNWPCCQYQATKHNVPSRTIASDHQAGRRLWYRSTAWSKHLMFLVQFGLTSTRSSCHGRVMTASWLEYFREGVGMRGPRRALC